MVIKTFFKIIFFVGFVSFSQIVEAQEMSMGFFMPKVEEETVLYLHAEKNLNFKPAQRNPTDSLTFKKLGYNIVLDYRPDWFAPIVEKLDYNIFYISVKKLGSRYVEIIANDETGKTIYIEKYSGDFVSWEEFLLNMHSVEFISKEQKVFDNPKVKSAGRAYEGNIFFRPLYIEGDWMQIDIIDGNYNETGNTGWIRWRKDGKLLVRYNLLS